jgi:hypothetical protein
MTVGVKSTGECWPAASDSLKTSDVSPISIESPGVRTWLTTSLPFTRTGFRPPMSWRTKSVPRAMIFCGDLIRQLPIKMKIGLMTVSSYPGQSLRTQGSQLVGQQLALEPGF